MRFGAARNTERAVAVDLTPMIDVVFLLIIFFMTTAQFARLTRADVELPLERGEQRASPDEAGLVININRDGGIVVSNRTIDLRELQSIVRSEVARHPGRPPAQMKLLIRADRTAPARHLNRVAEVLDSLGVGAVRLATEVPRSTPP